MNDTTQQAYRVLARKYRPKAFSELIGQDALVRTLNNAMTLGRLAHAFVLTGVRGVGKTSTARLLAKGLNCIGIDGNGGTTLEPCGQCEPCQTIAAGRHVDVLEIDAASHTGVDDAREIIEGVSYRPVSARFKIYIIDEVHMMSKNAFNALLKTLEEPPDAVKFIFATTEIRKVPVTIISRCQRYDLRRIPVLTLVDHLTKICEKEAIDARPEALKMIALAAEGSVRDALSLLDQAAALTADALTTELLADMLGRPGRSESQAVLIAALTGDTKEALTSFTDAHKRGTEPDMFIADLLDLIHLASIQAAGATSDELIDSEKKMILDLAKFGIARLGRAWQLLLKGHGELMQAPNPAASCEMLIIRLAHAAQMPTPGEILRKLPSAPDSASKDTFPDETQKVESQPAQTDPTEHPNTSALLSSNIPNKNAAYSDPNQALPQVINCPSKISRLKVASPNPTLEPRTLTDIVTLAEQHDEILLASIIRNHVRPVSLQPGRLEIALTANAPKTLAGDLTKHLFNWTGNQWLVSVSEVKGAKTIVEETLEADARLRDEIVKDPLVTKILEVFPGATIDTITPAPGSDKISEIDDDAPIVGDEEMSL